MFRCINVTITSDEYGAHTFELLEHSTYGRAKDMDTDQLTLCMTFVKIFISLLEVTMKLFKVPPSEFSRIDDHSGFSRVM